MLRHGRGNYVDQASLSRLLQATAAPILRAAQRAGDAAVDCHELVRLLPCRVGDAAGCRLPPPPVDVPLAAIGARPGLGISARLALTALIFGLLGGVLGGYLTYSILDPRNQANVSNPIRECVRPDGAVAGR
jgi:hypothetical protein